MSAAARLVGVAIVRLGLVLALAAGCVAAPCAGPPVRVQLLLVNDVYQLGPDGAGRGGLAPGRHARA